MPRPALAQTACHASPRVVPAWLELHFAPFQRHVYESTTANTSLADRPQTRCPRRVGSGEGSYTPPSSTCVTVHEAPSQCEKPTVRVVLVGPAATYTAQT